MEQSVAVLNDPRRLEIIEILKGGELPVGALVEQLPIAQSGVSRHLRILLDAGWVQRRTEGQRRLYSLRPEPFVALDRWLVSYRALWEHRLDNFDAALERRLKGETE